MDVTTLAMAKAYTNSQRLASVEENKFYLESIEGKPSIDIGADSPLYKVSDQTPDINSVVLVVAVRDGETHTFTAETLEIVDSGDYGFIASKEFKLVLCTVVPNDTDDYEKGVYLAYANEGFYASSIEFAETIHPIDPKYLPGVCLPVVELSSQETLTEAEQAQLTYYAEKASPILVKLVTDGVTVVSALFSYAFIGDSNIYHAFMSFGTCNMACTEDGVWSAQWE